MTWERESINNLIEKAILDADERGVKVLSLGLLNQVIIVLALHIYRSCTANKENAKKHISQTQVGTHFLFFGFK